MNISSLGVPSLTTTSGTRPVAAPQDNPASPGACDAPAGAAHTQLTKLGELMSKLQDLESSDPAKAKQVLSAIATALDKASSADGDPHLKALADKFTEAAKTGDLSGLKPHGGGHHHHHAAAEPSSADPASAAAASSSKTASYAQGDSDPRAQLESIVSDALASVAG